MVSQSSAANVTTASKVVANGQSFDLNISFDPLGTPIAGAQLNIAFNQSLFKVNSITEGNLFKINGASTFFNAGITNNPPGTVMNIFNAIIGPNKVSLPGTFIVVNMTATGSKGVSWINLSNVKVSDPNGQAVPLKIANGSVKINNPPVLVAIGNKVVNEGQSLTYTLSATDADGDTLTYSGSNLPAGASFNSGTRIFQWTPGYTQSGIYPNIQFKVSDGTATINENISINVNNVNIEPTLTPTPTPGNAPKLSWTGEKNYVSDGLNPETGNSLTKFTFRIKYTDVDNDAPGTGYPKVHIQKGGVEISGSPFTMIAADTNAYNVGRKYTYSNALSKGTDYLYYFEAHDSKGAGISTISINAPDVKSVRRWGHI